MAASKIAMMISEAMNNNTVINTCLGISFAVLAMRSVSQQTLIEALEGEKDSLVKSNKAMKASIWDWKQKLYAEADAAGGSAVVPLSTLKAIYGDVITPPTGDAARENKKSPVSNFVV